VIVVEPEVLPLGIKIDGVIVYDAPVYVSKILVQVILKSASNVCFETALYVAIKEPSANVPLIVIISKLPNTVTF